MLLPSDLIHNFALGDLITLGNSYSQAAGVALQPHAIAPHLPTDHLILGQMFQQDILGDLGKGFNTFVKTGRLWAMLIGFVIGFVFKSMTSYGS